MFSAIFGPDLKRRVVAFCMGIAICHRRKFGHVSGVYSSPTRSRRITPLPESTLLDLRLPYGKILSFCDVTLGCRLVTVTCSLLWVRCLFDWLAISDFGGKWPLKSKFSKMSFRIHRRDTVLSPNLVKIGRCEVAERSSGLPHKKQYNIGFQPTMNDWMNDLPYVECGRLWGKMEARVTVTEVLPPKAIAFKTRHTRM